MATMSFCINPIAFIPTDKTLHGTFAYAKTDWLETKLELEWWQSALAVGAIGIAKEFVDVVFGGKFDWNDIGADFVGYGAYRLVHFDFGFDIIPWAGSEEE